MRANNSFKPTPLRSANLCQKKFAMCFAPLRRAAKPRRYVQGKARSERGGSPPARLSKNRRLAKGQEPATALIREGHREVGPEGSTTQSFEATNRNWIWGDTSGTSGHVPAKSSIGSGGVDQYSVHAATDEPRSPVIGYGFRSVVDEFLSLPVLPSF